MALVIFKIWCIYHLSVKKVIIAVDNDINNECENNQN